MPMVDLRGFVPIGLQVCMKLQELHQPTRSLSRWCRVRCGGRSSDGRAERPPLPRC